jgi:hypothetical protein
MKMTWQAQNARKGNFIRARVLARGDARRHAGMTTTRLSAAADLMVDFEESENRS